MTKSETKQQLNKEFKNVKYILTSGMRTKLLLATYEESKNLEELRHELQKPSATILHGLKELESINLIKKVQKYYQLTSNGYLLTTNMLKLIDNWYAIDKNRIFWNNHDLTGIPDEMLKKIYLLKNCEYVHSTTSDLSNAFNHYINLLSTAKDIKIILPIYSENHLKHMIRLLNEGKTDALDLIINLDILNSIKNNPLFNEALINNDKVSITVAKTPLKLFLTSSENFMSLTLFFKDGHYDDSQILIGEMKDSIKWAEEINLFYKKKLKRGR
jgi:predicted transcriptional regulator